MIRKALIEDIPCIMSMARVVFPETYRNILSAGQIDYMMDMMYSEKSLYDQMTSGGHIFLIEEGCGYVSFRYDGLTDDDRDIFHIEKLYVLPACQKTGLGRRLFNKAVEMIRTMSHNSPRIELNVNRNNPAIGFYQYMGMKKDRSGDFAIGNGYFMNDYIMLMDCR